jgi:RecG-like helicase
MRSGSALYIVNDGTGRLPIFLAQPPEGRLPSAGSRIDAVGRLDVGADNALRLRVQSIDQISVEPEAYASDFRIDSIMPEQEGERIKVCGRVAMVWNPPPGSKAPRRIVLADPGGSMEVVYWFRPDEVLKVGDVLEIFGKIDLYKGRLQLKVARAGDMAKWPIATSAPVPPVAGYP